MPLNKKPNKQVEESEKKLFQEKKTEGNIE